MRAYAYTAYTDAGQRKTGTVIADTEAQASAELKAQGLFVEDLTPQQGATKGQSALSLARGAGRRIRLGADLQAVFTRQMAVLLAAEMPTEAALEAVRQGGHPALDAVAARARAELMEGASLSEALESTGAGWPAYYIASVRAGESAGDTATVMGELADHLETLGTDKAQISTALIYPAFVAAVSLLVCGILMTTVAPEIVSMFEMSGRPLPGLTRTMLSISDWISANALWLLIGAGGLLVLWGASSAIPRWRQARARFLLRLPMVGRLMRRGAAVQYLRTLALVLASRQPVLGATESASQVLWVRQFTNEGRAVTEAVRQGETLSSALERLSIIPPVARQLIAAGEASVRLARMTERAAMMVENALSTERRRIAALLEPMLMMLVGAFVLTIVLAVLLPIFDMQSMVAG
ncbi:type II secretion system F family protein [Alisedimentitalea sp. MJ-SS2]|uniref:type II secretion system F family protein n=1 Tax=Aliisedimentitalea sp. MJ-SS2 TaxID=3049795 RepID=UPI0029147B4A|nr:type II secretion system F family protein [Alisedimentitalea sp. MJ-SS2]MDU8925818.1 type II secretion system F family protein [Alisedimentitalea sp. MJ-SS2]